MSLDDEVRAVPDTDLVDRREEVVGGVPREHVGKTGLHTDADQGEGVTRLPGVGELELLVAELHAG